MLSYRHYFHAGNHADVLKHVVQSLIIESLKEKEKAFLYLDTHAGAGCYQLSDQKQYQNEYLTGIARIWQRTDLPVALQPYLSVVRALNPHDRLRYYPGSPLIARHLLRQQDKMHLTEQHSGDYPLLRNTFLQDKRVRVQKEEGWQQLKSQLPPLTRRGFILMDPSYEIKTDWQQAVTGIVEGHSRFATGIYALWYPVVLRQRVKRLLTNLQAAGVRNILQIELGLCPDTDRRGMTASGMIVVNPPWKLEQQMRDLLPWLHQVLAPDSNGHTLLKWIVPE